MHKSDLIRALNSQEALGSGDEILRVLTTMEKDKLQLLHRIMTQNYLHRKSINSDLLGVIGKNKYEVLKEEVEEHEQKAGYVKARKKNYYLLKYVFHGWKQLRVKALSRNEVIQAKLRQAEMRRK
jgi:hypothetical protein